MASSFAVPEYYRAARMDKVLNEDTGLSEVDPLSPRLHEMLRSFSRWQVITYAGERLTTIAYNVHGTTSTWWLILMFNGLDSMNELQPGMRLKIPYLQDIRAALQEVSRPIAETVTI